MSSSSIVPVVPEPIESKQGATHDFWFLPIPKRLQYDPGRPFQFTTLLNIAFGVGGTFVVMNVYYCQPLLIQFADSFGATDEDVAKIPTLVQAGYACGILLISPLGDLIRRRPLLLLLIFLTTTLTIGLCLTNSLVAFEAISFLVGLFSICTQIFIPYAADLAPPHRRSSAISIVLSAALFGVLLARVIGGLIAQFTSWRVVYYLAVGLQAATWLMLYIVLPDWPANNAGSGLTYFGIMKTMGKFALTEPTLIQASLISFAASAIFSNYWVTLTYLLDDAPYHYSTLVIGMFGFVGMAGVSTSPFVGRVVDRLDPWWATLASSLLIMVSQAIQTGAGGINIAAVVIAGFGIDGARQAQQVSIATSVYSVDAKARSRLNAVLLISIFLGFVMGTNVGSHIFVRFGWRADSAFAMGLGALQVVFLLIRGPHVQRFTWFGYEGGFGARKKLDTDEDGINGPSDEEKLEKNANAAPPDCERDVKGPKDVDRPEHLTGSG
ncbi:major facilitator superfamily domain-containing protein [Phellopilus nigrolimitatus]|nr:major facilitator superfamily domain-containing protein [Phellopilus nigrolimitatus]